MLNKRRERERGAEIGWWILAKGNMKGAIVMENNISYVGYLRLNDNFLSCFLASPTLFFCTTITSSQKFLIKMKTATAEEVITGV